MSAPVWLRTFSLGVLLLGPPAQGQGFVRLRGLRHPPDALPARCETWLGDIEGNDPSARIVVELCLRDGRVTGTFFWSSAISGWDRRALEGEWRDGGYTLTARDTAMLEAHPLHGWTLCTSDSYVLRRVSADRLEGVYSSSECRDQGRLSLTRRALPASPAPAPVSVPPHFGPLSPAAHLSAFHCSATPRLSRDHTLAWASVAFTTVCVPRRRRRRAQSGEA
jgi:hypothetical protein